MQNSDLLLSEVESTLDLLADTGQYVLLGGSLLGVAGIVAEEFPKYTATRYFVGVLLGIFVLGFTYSYFANKNKIKCLRKSQMEIFRRSKEIDDLQEQQMDRLIELIDEVEHGSWYPLTSFYKEKNREFTKILDTARPIAETKSDWVGSLVKKLFDLAVSFF